MTLLCYHAVDPDWRSSLAVSPDAFDEQCSWLASHRQVLDLPDTLGRLDGAGRLPRGTVALTFDDGFASVYEHAFPVLLRHRLPATVFLVAETLTPEGRAVDWVVPAPKTPPPTLTVDQVLEMQDAGVRFASHSWAHRDLTAMDGRECEDDLRRSREFLSDLLRSRVTVLAYPRGLHDETVRRAAAQAGYSHAFGLPEGREPFGRYAVPRVGIYPDDGAAAFRTKLFSWYLPLRTGRAYPALSRVARRRPSVEAGADAPRAEIEIGGPRDRSGP